MTPATQQWKQWKDAFRGLQKKAADEAALAMKDPNCKGTVSAPDHPDGDNRSELGLPENQRNTNSPGTLPRNILATDPNGVGQGEYITPENGDAKDKAYTSPTTPLSKIAETLQRGVDGLFSSAEEVATPAPVQPEKSASQEVGLPTDIKNQPDLMSKLAHFGAAMCATTEGQIALERQLKKQAGISEAHALIQTVMAENAAELQKAAAYQEAMMAKQAGAEEAAIAAAAQLTPAQMEKVAAAYKAHSAVMDQFQYPFEKQAYMAGAADAEAMDAGLQEDPSAPAIPGMEGQLTEEDIMEAIGELVQSGQIPPEAVEAILTELSADGEPGGSLADIATIIEQAVASGELAPEEAQQLVNEILANDPEAAAALGGGAPEGAPAEAPVEAAAAAAAAEDAVTKAASVLQSLFNPGK